MIANNAIYVSKEKSKNGIIIFHESNYCCVMSANKEINGYPLILLLKELADNSDSYEEWLHVVGKMMKKEYTSKYFLQPEEIHLNNGKFSMSIAHRVLSDSIVIKNKM